MRTAWLVITVKTATENLSKKNETGSDACKMCMIKCTDIRMYIHVCIHVLPDGIPLQVPFTNHVPALVKSLYPTPPNG
jgi:hypothetical protein